MDKTEINATATEIRVVCRGDLNAETVKAITADLAAKMETLPPHSFNVIIDLCAIEGCDIFGRSQLAEMQRLISRRAKRSAYVAQHSRYRGLGLWVIHLADDPNAKSVMSDEAVRAWLDGEGARMPSAREKTIRLADKLSKEGA